MPKPAYFSVCALVLSCGVASAQPECGRDPSSLSNVRLTFDLGAVFGSLAKLIGTPKLTGKVQIQRETTYQANPGISNDAINKQMFFAYCQTVLKDPTLTSGQKAQALTSFRRQLLPEPSTQAGQADYAIPMTPNAGASFEQFGNMLPIHPGRSGELVIQMRHGPFQLNLEHPDLTQSTPLGPALQVTASFDARLFETFEHDASRPSSRFFQPGTGMASDGLIAIDDLSGTDPLPHNYIVDDRFNVRDRRGVRGLLVNAISSQSNNRSNLLATAPDLYLILRQDVRGSRDPAIDFVRIVFLD